MSKKLRAVFVVVYSFAHFASAQDGTWGTRSSMFVPHVSGTTAVVDGELYSAGDSGANAADVELYDPTNDSWITIASLPTPVAYSFGARVGNKFYVIGGCQGQPIDCAQTTGTMQIYDTATRSWSYAPSMPTARNNPAGGVINGKIYVVGGDPCCNNSTNVLEVYDPVAGTWVPKTPMPTARREAASTVINGKLYVVGGFNGATNTIFAALEIYDPSTDTWTTGAPLPVPALTLNGMGVSLNGFFYVIGGTNNGGSSVYSGTVAQTNAAYAYNPGNNTWVTVSSIPFAGGIARAGVQEISGVMYVVGGDTVSGGRIVTLSSVESFTPAPYAAQVQPPISSDGSSVFKSNRAVIPVKFTLSQGGNPTCNLPPTTISLTETSGANPGPVNSSEYITTADNGSNFRIDSTGCQYVYNLGTSGLGTGQYLVQISIGNSHVGSATFGLN